MDNIGFKFKHKIFLLLLVLSSQALTYYGREYDYDAYYESLQTEIEDTDATCEEWGTYVDLFDEMETTKDVIGDFLSCVESSGISNCSYELDKLKSQYNKFD